ncbi:hypothetical protein FF011L_31480 [Roseimaritima multifibrata]|uniref:DUF1501 domain-containing protein n=1 Tax=Roseimaritima multifibrata TaxID=1930274 RepID=A0A517MHL6_9BACT|nr:DUF1501 domain-containing protein [Roseimaritima multifibrata]QDS94369.1 hypothetical protein FF011L_31480 [Roseimaritima multifibrata]
MEYQQSRERRSHRSGPSVSSRRHIMASGAISLAGFALATLLQNEKLKAETPAKDPFLRPELEPKSFDVKPKKPHFQPTAKAMISLWMQGGPSHLDLFDPKPELDKMDGKTFEGDIKYDNAAEASSKLMASPWKFSKHGECGMELSELLPGLAGVVDDITMIRSMHTGVNNHGQSIQALQNGRILTGRPTVGSWLTYGLGCETDNLPAYVALIDPGQLPVMGVENWTNGFLPSVYQGTVIRPKEPRILNLDPPAHLKGVAQKEALGFLEQLNRQHLAEREGYQDLEARIASYELASKMQLAAKEAVDFSTETKTTLTMYGLDDPATKDFGARCLIARRLIERGVRFAQVFTENQRWDHHGSIASGLPTACKKVDIPSAALVKDLKQRGMLDSTVVHWGGEMGRLPVIENDNGPKRVGRDHNTYGFSMWVAGGGFKKGHVYGATDELGHKAVENVVNHFDYHATLLHLFGLDAERLNFDSNNRTMSLLDNQGGKVIKGLLA